MADPPRGRRPLLHLCVALSICAVAAVAAWRVHRQRLSPTVKPGPAGDPAGESIDPELREILTGIDKALTLPTRAKDPPMELLRERESAFVSRRMAELDELLARAHERADRRRVSEAFLESVDRETAALGEERRSLNQLTNYRDSEERLARREDYKESRVRVFWAERERTRIEKEREHSSPGVQSRASQRVATKLKDADKRYAAARAHALEAELVLLERLRRQIEFTDPLYVLYNDEIHALKHERTMVRRTPRYRDVRDRTEEVEVFMEARRESERKQVARLKESQGRAEEGSALFWAHDVAIASLADDLKAPGEAPTDSSPEAAFASLADRLARQREVVDAKRAYCLAAAEAEPAARLFNECAVALQALLDEMDAIIREAE